MDTFGQTLRELRQAQGLGLRETAGLVGISPAYLSRIERGKESPPTPRVIKELARVLAADPDVLFRLSSSTDPDITNILQKRPRVLDFIRYIMERDVTDEQLDAIIDYVECELTI